MNLKLISLIIKNYKGLRNQIFDFNDHYFIRDQELFRKEDIDFPFYKSISNITALIGKNGTGKSTVLEVIQLLLDDSDILCDAVLLIEFQGIIYYLGMNHGIKFEGQKIPRMSFSLLERSQLLKSIFLYSPVYNPHALKTKKTYIADYSNDSFYSFARQKNKESDLKLHFDYLVFSSDFSLGLSENKALLEVSLAPIKFHNLISPLLNLNTHVVKSSKSFKSEFKNLQKQYLGTEFENVLTRMKARQKPGSWTSYEEVESDILSSKINVINEMQFKLSFEDYVRVNLAAKNLLNVLKEMKKKNSPEFELQNLKFIEDALKIFRSENLKDWLNDDLYILNYEDGKNPSAEETASSFFKILPNDQKRRFPIRFSASESDLALSFIRKLRLNDFLKYNFSIGWQGVSSGQLARINFYSRLLIVLKTFQGDNLTILLDEADIYLHPEWQRTFLFDLETFIASYSSLIRQINVDIILTTHSPLMISDLKHGDVYLLQENGKSELINSKTFGANLYDLYRDEFVVSSPRGELANDLIKSVASNIESRILEADKIKYFINNIGDPVLKSGLLSLVDHVKSKN